MSAQLLELLFFAGIAFFIINKLISVLGNTTEDDIVRKNSHFGENNSSILKDVTNTVATNEIVKNIPTYNIDDIIVIENQEDIFKNIILLNQKINFDPHKFIKNAKTAFEFIINSSYDNTINLEELIDKRYLEEFQQKLSYYGKINNLHNLSAKISEVYIFGNTAFVKVIFKGLNITNTIYELKEEWTFSKNTLVKDKIWYLSNIENI